MFGNASNSVHICVCVSVCVCAVLLLLVQLLLLLVCASLYFLFWFVLHFIFCSTFDRYSKESIEKRRAIRQHSEMLRTLSLFWGVLDHEHDRRGRLRFESYAAMNLKLQKALAPEFDLDAAYESAQQDWASDLAGKEE
jgi:hypothetical protein